MVCDILRIEIETGDWAPAGMEGGRTSKLSKQCDDYRLQMSTDYRCLRRYTCLH